MTASALPSVSVVINTLDRAAHLEDALLSLQGLDYPRFEVVVVNGPSSDGTADLLERWKDRIKVEACAEANLAVSRNVGISAASGEVVCFLDDDAAPHPQWLRNLMPVFNDPTVGGAGGFTIDNTGARWQVRKTVCDRFGNAFNVSSMFDERPLNEPGVAYYPSLLGTNCAFRRKALLEIGGFDHAFAYLLDETDVCLRLIDAGWKVLYEPTALVYHQFAPSHIRTTDRVARTLYPSAVSKSYFIMRHGAAQSPSAASAELERYREEILTANDWLNRHSKISDKHRFSLDQDLLRGIQDGVALARTRDRTGGDLATDERRQSFKPFASPDGLRIAFVTQGFPPAGEAGIGRWTLMAAKGLAARGHMIHVITAASGEDESVSFVDGLWVHRLKPDAPAAGAIVEAYNIPASLAAWCARVWRETQHLKSFGLQLLSFPIWDLEGLPLLDDADVPVVVSLHTTYKMAKPFKPEWSARPLFEYHHIDRVIAAEAAVLANAPVLLANSSAVMDAIEDLYDVDVRPRSTLVPHGVVDPLNTRAARAKAREEAIRNGAPLRALFVGRFEARKGFDIAARAAGRLVTGSDNVEVWFAGDHLSEASRRELRAAGLGWIEEHPSVRFLGILERDALDDAYVDCDVLLAPSRFESFGLIAIEAMAARRPVLALASGGLAEVVEDQVTGYTWFETPDVAEKIADMVFRLESERGSLLALGARARDAYEQRYTVETMVEGMEALYRRILSAKPAEIAYEH